MNQTILSTFRAYINETLYTIEQIYTGDQTIEYRVADVVFTSNEFFELQPERI